MNIKLKFNINKNIFNVINKKEKNINEWNN